MALTQRQNNIFELVHLKPGITVDEIHVLYPDYKKRHIAAVLYITLRAKELVLMDNSTLPSRWYPNI